MLLRLILIMTVIPIIELLLLLRVHGYIAQRYDNGTALLLTVGMIVATGVIGASLARTQGLNTLRKIQDNLARGIVPGPELIDGLFILIGGALLLTPGFLTDLVGFMLLLPPTRLLLRSRALAAFQRAVSQGTFIYTMNVSRSSGRNESQADDIIDL